VKGYRKSTRSGRGIWGVRGWILAVGKFGSSRVHEKNGIKDVCVGFWTMY
jgi:hypothetical protein